MFEKRDIHNSREENDGRSLSVIVFVPYIAYYTLFRIVFSVFLNLLRISKSAFKYDFGKLYGIN